MSLHNKAACILVVSLGEDSRVAAASLLSATGFQIVEATNSLDALAKASANDQQLDLILLNGKCVDTNGADICYLLKNNIKTKSTIILQICSASDNSSDKNYSHSSDADHYLVRPFSAEELIANVGLLLRLGAVEREIRDGDQRNVKFLTILQHELRNPLAPILNSVELLFRLNSEISHAQEKALNTIRNQTRYLAQVLDDLSDKASIPQPNTRQERKSENSAAVQANSDETNLSADSQPSAASTASNSRVAKRILVVDDNVEVADTLTQWLKLGGHVVHTVYTGAEAIKFAPEFLPDIVLLDISLPDVNGFEVAKKLRELPDMKKFVIVAVTGYGHESAKKTYLERGFDEHFVKPMGVEKLRSIGIHI